MTEERSDDNRKVLYLNELDDGTDREGSRSGRISKGGGGPSSSPGGLFGMRPGQAFFIAAILLIFVILAGMVLLVLMDKMAIPF